jgi:hypothetical protein
LSSAAHSRQYSSRCLELLALCPLHIQLDWLLGRAFCCQCSPLPLLHALLLLLGRLACSAPSLWLHWLLHCLLL